MRRPAITLTAAALAAGLLLAACGSENAEDAEPTADETAVEQGTEPGGSEEPEAPPTNSPDDIAALEAVAVEGGAGSAPTLTFDQPMTVDGPAAILIDSGDGAPISSDRLLVVDILQVDGTDGAEVFTTYGATPETMMLGDLIPAVSDLFDGEGAGARVLFAAPGPDAAVLMVLEAADARELRATGEPVDVPDGLPAVTRADDGEPSIEAVDGAAPGELVVTPVLEGDGKAIEEGDHVIVQYSGWLWDGTPFDDSWSREEPFTLTAGAGEVIEGWDTGLLGQTVGSQVLFVIPPELGYGDRDQGTIPPDSTLVFVVDIIFAG